MKAISKLKDEARRYEQREEWEKAIQAYIQVLKNADDGESEVELPLYNRVGDLCVRLGRPQEAVKHYEQAADRYAEAGLYNNAIALCNKALRYSPDRLELIRKLGSFSASQGFVTDARRHFLDYAERQFRSGKVNEALTALEDFANVGDDPEIRAILGRQLHAHGRTMEALEELRRAHAMRVSAGETEQAEALRQEILSIDPNVAPASAAPQQPAAPAPAAEAAADLPFVEFETPGQDSLETGSSAPAETSDIAGLERGALPGDDVDSIEVAGFETSGEVVLEDFDRDVAGIDGLETAPDFGEVASAPGGLADLGIERQESQFAGSRDAETFDLDGVDDSDFESSSSYGSESTFDLPLLDEPDPEPTPLPLLEVEQPVRPPERVDPLAGDLRIDLNSLGGFSLTTPPAAPSTPPPESLDVPEPPVEEAAPAPAPEPEPAVEPPEATVDPPVDPVIAVDGPDALEAEAVEIPSIEIPTWETEPRVETTPEPYEESWVDASAAGEPEEEPVELPTFAYDEEDEPVTLEAEPVEAEPVDDVDPLNLASHLGGRAPEPELEPEPAPVHIAPAATPEPDHTASAPPLEIIEPEPEPEVTAASTDWLDDIEGKGEVDEPAPWEVPPEPEPGASRTADAADAGFVDLGALLAGDDAEGGTRFRVQESVPTGDEDRDFAELLNQFKAKVHEHLPHEDAAAHYDLGLAYKEMDLIDEAIGEFQIALRDGHMRLRVYEELGQCFLRKEQYNIAEKVLSRALGMKFDDELELLGVYYHLGRAYEALGHRDQARDAYERVLGMDINFEDVTARLARL